MPQEALLQRGKGLVIKPQDQFLSRWRAKDFVEEDFEVRIGHHVQPQWRLAHLTDPLTQRGDVFGAQMRVQAEAHLEFVDWLGSDARGKDLMQAFAGVMVTLEPADTFLDR